MCPIRKSARGAATSQKPKGPRRSAAKNPRPIRFVSGQVLAPHVGINSNAFVKYVTRSTQVTRVDQLPENLKAPLSCQIKVVPHPTNQTPLRERDLEDPEFDKDDPSAAFALPNNWIQRIFDAQNSDITCIHPILVSPLLTREQKYFFYHMHITGRIQTRAQWIHFLEAVAQYPEHREWAHGILSIREQDAPYYQQAHSKTDALSQIEKLWADFYHHVSPGIPPDLESMDFAPQDALLHMVHFIGDWYSEHILHEPHFEPVFSFLIEQVLKSKTPFPEFWLEALFEAYDLKLKNRKGHRVFLHLSKLPLLHQLYTQHRSQKEGITDSIETTHKYLVKSLIDRILHDRNRFISEDDGLIFLYNEIQKALGHYHELEDKSQYEHPVHFESLLRVYKNKFLYDKKQSDDRGKHIGFAMVHEYLMTTDADFAKQQATLIFKKVFGDTPPNYSQSLEFKIIKQRLRLYTVQQRFGSNYRHLSEDASWILNTDDYPEFKTMSDLAEFCQKWGLLPDREAKTVRFGLNTILKRVAREGFEVPQHQAIKGYSRPGPKEPSKPQLVKVIKGFIRSGHNAIYNKAETILEDRRFSPENYFQSIAHPAQEVSYQITMTEVEDDIPRVIPMGLTLSPFTGIYGSSISLVPQEDGIKIGLETDTKNIYQLGLPDDGTGFGVPTSMSTSPRRTHIDITLNKSVQYTLSSEKPEIHINQTNTPIIQPIHPDDPKLKLWIDLIGKRLAQDPLKSIVKVVEQVLSESFDYDDQLTDDIDYRSFIETFDPRAHADIYALWQRMHEIDAPNKTILARGRDLELSLLTQAILASLHIESKILFAHRTHPVIRENHDARTGPLRSFVVIPNKNKDQMEYIILDPAVNDPDRLEAIQNHELGQLYQDERLVKKELSALKTSRLALENKDPHHVSNKLILSSALVVGLGVLGGVHLGAHLVSERVNASMSQQNNPNLTPLSDLRERSNKWDLETEDGHALPEMIVQSYNYDFLGKQSASPAKLHPVLSGDSQHTVTVRPHDPDLITYFSGPVELYPVGGQKVQEQAFGPAVTYSVSNTNLIWHDQISDPVDARLLQLEVPEEWIADRLGNLEALRGLPIAERIAIAEMQIQDDFVYLYDMGQDPLNVSFANQWNEKDPDQLQKYWQHIFNPQRQINDLSPGQCKEMSFVLVQYLRALSVPSAYARGYGVNDKTQRTTAPHRNAVAFVSTDHGLTPQLVLQASLTVDNEHPKENNKTEESGLTKKNEIALSIALSLFMSLWGFFELHSGLLNRRRKKKLEDIEKKIKATKKNLNIAKNAVEEALENQEPRITSAPVKEFQAQKPTLTLSKVPVSIPRTLGNQALDEALFFLGDPVPLVDRSNTSFLLSQLESTLEKQFYPHKQIRINVPGTTLFSKERLKKQARKRMRDKALEWQQMLEQHNFQSKKSKELVQSLLQQVLADDFPTPEFVYDFEVDGEDYLVTAARLGLTIIR